MRKILIASALVVLMLASTTPIFAANTKNATSLSSDQLAKLDATQSKINDLVVKINNLTTTYNNTKNTGLLVALKQFKKQAKILNAQISWFKNHPKTKNADKIIASFQKRESQLAHKVNNTAKILNKTQNKTNKT